jgi:hypothetical protein
MKTNDIAYGKKGLLPGLVRLHSKLTGYICWVPRWRWWAKPALAVVTRIIWLLNARKDKA